MRHPLTLKLLAVAGIVCMAASAVVADGMIVPVAPELRVRGSWAVKHHNVDVRVRDQVAKVTIDQAFVNTGRREIEVEYLFPIPPDAAIKSMTMVVDGKELTGKLLDADKARKIYNDIVRRKKDPALLEYVGYGLFKTSAFPLAPGKPVKVVINYTQVCPRDSDTVEVWYPLNTEKFSAKPLEEVRVTVDVRSKTDIGPVYSPTHDLTVKRDPKDPTHVTAEYSDKNVLPTFDFQMYYTTSSEKVGATLLTHQPVKAEDGYFMLLVSPNPRHTARKAVPKDVVIVLDRSGSMGGDKIRQALEAVRFVLNNLNEEDRFNVVAYSDTVEPFFDELQPVNDKTLKEARSRLDAIDAEGGTYIWGALQDALKMVPDRKKGGDGDRPAYVLFLTDGKPTVGDGGKKEEKVIINDAVKANKDKHARIFAFGVGYGVNVRLLDKLVMKNHGRSDYVKPKEDIEAKISSLYRKIRNPVMTDLAVEIEGIEIRKTYPRQLGDLFEGDQLVVVGRYSHDADWVTASEAKLVQRDLVVRGRFQGKKETFEYNVTVNPPGHDSRYEFVEQLWALRRIAYLLDEIALGGEEQELVDEVIRLSKEYGIMTPYTSFLADEEVDLADAGAMRDEFSKRGAAADLARPTGGQGQLQATNRQVMRESVSVGKAMNSSTKGAKITGNTSVEAYEDGEAETVANVRNVSGQAMYRRGKVWVTPETADVDLEKDADEIETIERFSKEYFNLAESNTAAQNRLLATQQTDEQLLVKLRGQVYLIK